MLGPLKLEPIPVARPWGGRLLTERYGKPAPANDRPLGETWEASDVGKRASRIACGPLKGATLTMVFQQSMPLLIKLIHAREWLSLQVHPDETAVRHLRARLNGHAHSIKPKHEAWHVLWAEPGAEIIYGSKSGVTTPQLLAACKDGTVAKLCHRVRVHVGDTIMVPAGMVHA
ncbi:MAG: type I phosphomannose isomerase catalytic subunit, partial [Planctomycetota bacterium]